MADAEKRFTVDVRVRLFAGDTLAYGKGINRLLHLCREYHSLHKAAEEMRMSYRKALQIVQRAERCFNRPLLERSIGGKDGGGSRLTAFGEELVAAFSAIEAELDAAAQEKVRRMIGAFPKR